jgi:hypothetical protein
MTRTTLLQRQSISVSDFRCSAGPDDTPFVEQYGCHSISYVRKGSFGCRCRGRSFELVAGSILVGYPGDEFTCTHDHACGDECLSFFSGPELTRVRLIWIVDVLPEEIAPYIDGQMDQAALAMQKALGRNAA